MIKKLLKPTLTLLGRWEHRLTPSQIERKFILNNLDHCGDKICGNMQYYKNKKDKDTRKVS